MDVATAIQVQAAADFDTEVFFLVTASDFVIIGVG